MGDTLLQDSKHQHRPRFAGIHLSGPNAGKTAVVVLSGEVLKTPLKVEKVYEKIGVFGTLFSDDRIFEILERTGPFLEVFVDSPLTMPPCVRCERPVCPGIVSCDDLAVAYMFSVSQKLRRKAARKARPINPQSQRLWDVLQIIEQPEQGRLEPSFSANLAPLVARARTLQRRLNALSRPIVLKETSVSAALARMGRLLSMKESVKADYRNFERGHATREMIVNRMISSGFLKPMPANGDDLLAYAAIIESVEVFNAFVCAWIAALHQVGLTQSRPDDFVPNEGWVYLPTVAAELVS